jgi:2-polyprenyl-3-methyl-5-hydroxy-6-metoxy-1,4-benzoquinol methylase
MFRTNCLICGSAELNKIVDLGIQPFADTFVSKEKLQEVEPVYPLECDLCTNCGQVQASAITKPEDRYSLHDYSYTSSNSGFSRGHWDKFAVDVPSKLNLDSNSFIVEAGSNDGYLGEQLQKNNMKVLWVYPSDYMARLASERGVKTFVGLFDSSVVGKIVEENGKADLVIANNVFNHSENPLDFARAACSLLKDSGTFVFELPYWISTLESEKFDQIYHEHVSYFTVKSSKELLERVGMKIKDVDLVDYHGGSIRVYAGKEEFVQENQKVKDMIDREVSMGAFNLDTYKKFMESILNRRHNFMQKINEIKARGEKIIGVGAAAKANTFLNFYGLDKNILDYVTDASPHKKGKFTPLTRIPIDGDEVFGNYGKVNALILSWNISGRLKEILSSINPEINYLSLPE